MLFSAQLCSHASQVLIWRERWRFDQDGESTIEPEGADKQDRVLIDDYDPIFFLCFEVA